MAFSFDSLRYFSLYNPFIYFHAPSSRYIKCSLFYRCVGGQLEVSAERTVGGHQGVVTERAVCDCAGGQLGEAAESVVGGPLGAVAERAVCDCVGGQLGAVRALAINIMVEEFSISRHLELLRAALLHNDASLLLPFIHVFFNEVGTIF